MTHTYTVTGMSCDGCEQNVIDALSKLEGIEDVNADHETDTVTVDGDFDEETARNAIEGAGYEVEA